MSLKRKLNKMLLLYTSKKRCPRCPFSWASTIRWVWWWVCFFILSGLGTRLTGQSASRAVTLLFRSCKMFGTKVWTRLCAFLFSFFLFLFNIQIFNCRLFLLKCCLFRPWPRVIPSIHLFYFLNHLSLRSSVRAITGCKINFFIMKTFRCTHKHKECSPFSCFPRGQGTERRAGERQLWPSVVGNSLAEPASSSGYERVCAVRTEAPAFREWWSLCPVPMGLHFSVLVSGFVASVPICWKLCRNLTVFRAALGARRLAVGGGRSPVPCLPDLWHSTAGSQAGAGEGGFRGARLRRPWWVAGQGVRAGRRPWPCRLFQQSCFLTFTWWCQMSKTSDLI